MLKMTISTLIGISILGGLTFWYLTYYQERCYGSLDLNGRKIIIFDFDGTLCDSYQSIVYEFNAIAPNWNVIPVQNVEETRSIPLQDMLKKHGVNKWKLPFIKYQLTKNIRRHVPNMRLFSGMREALFELKREGYTLGILSSNSYENILQFLTKYNIENFTFIYHGSSLFGKARLLEYIKAKTKASVIYYIGDENRDIEAAKAAKIPFIAVTWGYQTKSLLSQYHPTYIVDTPDELSKILKQEK